MRTDDAKVVQATGHDYYRVAKLRAPYASRIPENTQAFDTAVNLLNNDA